jgi:type IV pilus assembly protein PilC
MKRFKYRAKETATGKTVKGSIQAESERLAGKLLMDRGYMPIDLTEERLDSGLNKILNRVTLKDKIVFTRQFATLIGSGLPLSAALATVADQTQNKIMKGIVEDVLSQVESGKSLSEAMEKYPDTFDNVYRALISAGEVSGTLDQSLIRLAIQQEKDAETMSKIRGAMVYPAIVLLVMVMVMLFMVFAVVPQVQSLYSDLGQTLPAITQILVAVTNFLLAYWWAVLIGLGVAGYLFWQWLKTEPGVKFSDTFKLNVPLFSRLTRRLYMARFCRTTQILLATGVSMLDVLKISGEAVNNTIVQAQIDDAATRVKGGALLSNSLKDKEYVLPLVPQMISIGEKSGKIDEMLGKAAQIYEDELDEQIRNLSTMIEPILMVILAIMAGGLIVAVLLPIYQIVNVV